MRVHKRAIYNGKAISLLVPNTSNMPCSNKTLALVQSGSIIAMVCTLVPIARRKKSLLKVELPAIHVNLVNMLVMDVEICTTS